MISTYTRTLFLVLISLLSFVGTASAATVSPDYDILKVLVNNIDITGRSLDVERGEQLDIEVWVQGTINVTLPTQTLSDVRVEAKVLGYEFGAISDVSEIFSIDGQNLYKKTLVLDIPKDIDASEQYTLRIEVSDTLNQEEQEFTVYIDEQRHNIDVFDIVLNPSSTIQAGQPLFVSTVLENMGEKKEENIKVTVSVPELGISSVNYLDELITQIMEDKRTFNLQEESSQRVDFLLRIPADAASGQYTINVDILYNRGHSFLSASRTFTVVGIATEETDTIVNIDSTSKSVKQDEEIIYKVMFANLGTERGVYSLQVDGVSWAQYRVEPGFITVAPDGTAEAMIYLKPNANTEPKNYVSVVRILSGREILQEFTINTNVLATATEQPAASTTSAVKTVLVVVFAVLIIVLIVLGLVIAFRKVKEPEQDETVSNVPAGQTYYNHPRR